MLEFVPHPRWFVSVGAIKLYHDIPLLDQGASLSFDISPQSDGHLKFDLSINAKERVVFFQVEHRRNDITPFLFALSADGKAIDAQPYRGGAFGGVTSMNVLTKNEHRTNFSLTIDPKTVLALIGDKKFTKLSVVAAFCERRQESTTGGIRMKVGESGGIAFSEEADEAVDFWGGQIPPIVGDNGEDTPFQHPPILIRSAPVTLIFSEGKWSAKAKS